MSSMKLTEEPCLYADMLQCRKAGGQVLYETENALLLQGKISKILYSSAADEQAGKEIVKHLPEQFEILVAHDTYTDPWLKSMRRLHCELECVHCVYVEEEPPTAKLPKGFIIKRLDASHIQRIIAMYRHSMESLANEAYINECLKDGMYGAFYGDELCGFIGVHEQESIGILEVHPTWQRQGLAVALERVMIAKQLERGRLPYGEIVRDNFASIRLQKKAGMITDEKLTYWYFP